MSKKIKMLYARVDEELMSAASQAAEREKRTLSAFVRKVLQEYLAENDPLKSQDALQERKTKKNRRG
jgi:metal-responsive CopG/Arc/MetJ family transcriptional regulator